MKRSDEFWEGYDAGVQYHIELICELEENPYDEETEFLKHIDWEKGFELAGMDS